MLKTNLLLFLISRFLSALGDQLLLFALPLLVYKATGSIALSGLAFFVEWLPRIISLPIAGVLSDKLGGKKIYLIADFSRSTICLSTFLLLLIYPQHTFSITSITMALCAFFYAQSFIALEATMPKLVEPIHYAHAQSIIQGVEQSTIILGPSLATLISLFLPTVYLLILTSLVFLFSFFGIFLTKGLPDTTLNRERISLKNILQDMQQGIGIIFNHPKLVWLVILTISINLIWGLALASNAAMITGIFGRPASVYGLLQTSSGIVGTFIFFLIPFIIRYYSVFALGMTGYICMMLGGLLIGLSTQLPIYVIGYVLVMTFDGVFNVYIRSERLKVIPKAHLGKTIGIIVLVNQLSLPLAGLLLASFSPLLGPRNLMLLVSIGSLMLLTLFLLKSVIGKVYIHIKS